MSPDDPRHGTRPGYRAGCREECCRRAQMRYMKVYRMGRSPKMIPSLGTRRRVQALLALGWTHREMGERIGRCENYTHDLLYGESVRSDIAALVDGAYREMCMTRPEGWYPERNRRYAARKGYLPPLAWDDIDNPDERPTLGSNYRRKTDVDPVVVERVLAGDRLAMTTAERREVVARARVRGWSFVEIEERTGVTKVERYVEKGDAA